MNKLHTIGYEGTDLAQFTQTLIRAGVKVLADVRAVPVSRKKGFSKRVLAELLLLEGIRYVHFKDLGDPKDGRDAAKGGRYDEFRRIYARHLRSAAAMAALEELARIARVETTCLMCFERDPAVCHRSMIANKLDSNEIVSNLYTNQYVHSDLLPRRGTRQGATAAQQTIR